MNVLTPNISSRGAPETGAMSLPTLTFVEKTFVPLYHFLASSASPSATSPAATWKLHRPKYEPSPDQASIEVRSIRTGDALCRLSLISSTTGSSHPLTFPRSIRHGFVPQPFVI